MRQVADGVLRGMIAAMAMTGMRAVSGGLGVVEQTPPQAMARKLAPRTLRRVPRRRRDAVIEVAHWLYGAVGGGAYTQLPEGLRARRSASAAYGLVLWLGFELVLSPALDLPQRGFSGRKAERVALAADHVLYGLVLAQTRPRILADHAS